MKITNQCGPDIPNEFIGLFIEDINYAVDGGLYAEMLENRNFESLDIYGGENCDYYAKYDGLYAWSSNSPALHMEVVQGSPVSERNPHYLRVTCEKGGSSFRNQAYSGIHMRPGVACQVSFYARRVRYQGVVTVAVTKDGVSLLSETVELRPAGVDGWNRWERYQLALCPETEITGGQFEIILNQEGVVEFDCFSMMPEDAVLGIFRRDLAEALKELHPGFLRFPGECVVEGNTLNNRYRFKDTWALWRSAAMTGMARNSDAVVMTCYAPLLARIGYAQWSPDLIWFDEKAVYRTPNYYVQQLFAENLGTYNICLTEAPVPCQASYDEELGELVLMMVNSSDKACYVPVLFDSNWSIKSNQVTEILLTGNALNCKSTPEAETVRPICRQIPLSESYQMVPFSFVVLHIPAAKTAGNLFSAQMPFQILKGGKRDVSCK